ncbi:hypothetical protein [Maribacter sp. 2-571]
MAIGVLTLENAFKVNFMKRLKEETSLLPKTIDMLVFKGDK